MLNIVKLNLLNKKEKIYTENEVKTSKHFPSSTREWNNSIYVYNKNGLNLIPNAMISAIKIIKGYFSLYNYKIEKKIRTKRLSRKFRRLSSNKIYISNGEFKHTNNKIIINLYLYNRQKDNYMLALKKLYLKTIKKTHKFNLKMNNKFNNFNKYKFKNKHNTYESKNIRINKYKLINFKPWSKSLTSIKIHMHKLRTLVYLYNNDKQGILNLYNKYKTLYAEYNEEKNTNLNKYKLKCTKYNLYKLKSIKLFNRYLKNTNFNKYKLVNFKPFRPKSWTSIKINKDKFKITKPYNKFEQWIIDLFEKYILENTKKKNNIAGYTIFDKKDSTSKYTKFNKSIVKKINIINKKGLLLLYLINREKYLIIKSLNHRDKKIHTYISNYIIEFYKKFLKRSWRKLKIYFFYRQLMYINKSKYNYNYLQYLNKYLSSLYNKNIEYNLINLKRFYLHSDILSESMKLKLTINKRRMLKQLNIMKKKIKIKDYKKVLHKKFFGNKLDLKKNLIKSPNFQRKEIVKNLNYKHITGFRLEAKGRLTRRYTASRSVSKIRYKGNLLNIYSSYKGMSTVLLKGNLKSNLQYTKLKSKSRIGSFGIKGWISGS